MPFKKIEDEVLACAFNKIDNRKIRKIFHEENLAHIRRVNEIESKNIPKDRRLERVQIMLRLKSKFEEKEKERKFLDMKKLKE